jgi:archaemetzincin
VRGRKPQELTEELLSDSRKRYSADKILKKYRGSGNVLILMEEDIAVHDTARSSPEWGIIGLGYRPGNTCVVSTFRLKRKVSNSKAEERLRKVAIHEIGHNLGIDHCTSDPECLMNDANGTVKQIDKERFFICEACRKSVRL